MNEERLAYRFGPVERRGLLGQVRAGQAGVIAAGAAAAIWILDQDPTGAGVFLGVIGFGAAMIVAFAPLGRRTPEEWAPVAVSFALRWARRRLRFRSLAGSKIDGCAGWPEATGGGGHEPSRARGLARARE